MNNIKIGDEVVLVEPFRVFRLLADGRLDICDSEGNCISVEPNQVTLKQIDMKAMKNAVLSTAKDLLKANNTVTTLEIKLQLRKDFPYYYWDQSTVSKYMDGFAGDGIFHYRNSSDGTHRIYSLMGATGSASYQGVSVPSAKVAVPTKSISKIQTKNKMRANQKTVRRSTLSNFVQNTPNIDGVYLVTGKYVTVNDITRQKKSLLGYINQRPNLVAIQVGNSKITVR